MNHGVKLANKIVWIVTVISVILMAENLQAEDLKVRQPKQEEIGKRATCPVANFEFEVGKTTPVIDYRGKSYYFCCEPCIKDFKKDPEKYTETRGLSVRQPTQSEIGKRATCAGTNSTFEVNKTTPVIDYKGKSYYFCTTVALESFKKNPDGYAK
jgi:YHS domain-containing protein